MSYLNYILMEKCTRLIVDPDTTLVMGIAERDAALTVARCSINKAGATLAGDRGYDAAELIKNLRDLKIARSR